MVNLEAESFSASSAVLPVPNLSVRAAHTFLLSVEHQAQPSHAAAATAIFIQSFGHNLTGLISERATVTCLAGRLCNRAERSIDIDTCRMYVRRSLYESVDVENMQKVFLIGLECRVHMVLINKRSLCFGYMYVRTCASIVK